MCRHYQRMAVGGLVLGGILAAEAWHPVITASENAVITVAACTLTAGMLMLIMVLVMHSGPWREHHRATHPQHAHERDQVPITPDPGPVWPNVRLRSLPTPGHEYPGEPEDTYLRAIGGEYEQ